MPILKGVYHEEKQVEAIAVGAVTFADIESHLLAEIHFGGLAFKELVDARAASIVWTPHEILSIVEFIQRLSEKSKLGPIAVLVSTDVSFDAVRALELSLQGIAEVRPFRSEEEARNWLGQHLPADAYRSGPHEHSKAGREEK